MAAVERGGGEGGWGEGERERGEGGERATLGGPRGGRVAHCGGVVGCRDVGHVLVGMAVAAGGDHLCRAEDAGYPCRWLRGGADGQHGPLPHAEREGRERGEWTGGGGRGERAGGPRRSHPPPCAGSDKVRFAPSVPPSLPLVLPPSHPPPRMSSPPMRGKGGGDKTERGGAGGASAACHHARAGGRAGRPAEQRGEEDQ